MLIASEHQLETTNDALAAGAYQVGNTNDPLAARAHQLGSTSNPLAARVYYLVNIGNSPLAAGVHHSGANTSDPLAANEQLGTNDACDPHKGHQLENESISIPLNFDPASVLLEDEYTFSAALALHQHLQRIYSNQLLI